MSASGIRESKAGPSFFYDQRIRVIYTAIAKLLSSGQIQQPRRLCMPLPDSAAVPRHQDPRICHWRAWHLTWKEGPYAFPVHLSPPTFTHLRFSTQGRIVPAAEPLGDESMEAERQLAAEKPTAKPASPAVKASFPPCTVRLPFLFPMPTHTHNIAGCWQWPCLQCIVMAGGDESRNKIVTMIRARLPTVRLVHLFEVRGPGA